VRSADRSRLFFLNGDNSSGPIYSYTASSGTFGPVFNVNASISNYMAAASRDGSLLAYTSLFLNSTVVRSGDLNTLIQSLPNVAGAVLFDPNRDVLYALHAATNEIYAYDTVTW